MEPDRVCADEAFASSFSQAWRRDGWGAPNEADRLELPWVDRSRRHVREWKVKARSLKGLFQLLDRIRPTRVVDLGCGFGWLSHILAGRGHEVYAIDLVLDEVLGLAAADVYMRAGTGFERVWGEIEHPPLRDQSVDAIICNASLHYALDLRGTLFEIERVLRPGGFLIVMNSPVHANLDSAQRAQSDFRKRLQRFGAAEEISSSYHHFFRDDLESTIRDVIGPVFEERFDLGRSFRLVRSLKGMAFRMQLASFPLLYAPKKPS